MKRDLGWMSKNSIDRICKIIENNETQLHHYGESLFFPGIVYYAIESLNKKNVKSILNTNGEFLTNEICSNLVDRNIHQIIISYHNDLSLKNLSFINKEFREKITIIKITEDLEKQYPEFDKLKEQGFNIELKRLRNLGNVNIIKDSFEIAKSEKCSFVKNNEFVVLWNGDIVPCCECFDDTYKLGNIFNDNLQNMNNIYFSQCKNCLGYGNEESETEKITY